MCTPLIIFNVDHISATVKIDHLGACSVPNTVLSIENTTMKKGQISCPQLIYIGNYIWQLY